MLKLRSKSCQIGVINCRLQRKGEEREPYFDIPFTVSLTSKELASLLGDAHIPDAWFTTTEGKLDEPLLKNFAPYRFQSKFANSLAVFTVGLKELDIDCGDCTINKLVFTPTSDGRTLLTGKVQTAATAKTIDLILWMGTDQDVVLQFGELVGDEAQEELPLEVEDDEASNGKAVGSAVDESLRAPALN